MSSSASTAKAFPPVVILVGCQHPGNLGAVARTMGNFGLRDLRLVGGADPADPEAVARAREMNGILASAGRHDTLKAALEGIHQAYAASHRAGRLRAAPITPRAAATLIASGPPNDLCAFVFGNESSGLTNDEVLHCDRAVSIPTDPNHPSLNLSHAVTVLAYEWAVAGRPERQPVAREIASAAERRGLYEHMEEAMLRAGYLDPLNTGRTLRHVTQILNRARVSSFEVTLLRGLMRKIQHIADRAGRPSAEEITALFRRKVGTAGGSPHRRQETVEDDDRHS
jgi:TrmH family RNA methyltransferase